MEHELFPRAEDLQATAPGDRPPVEPPVVTDPTPPEPDPEQRTESAEAAPEAGPGAASEQTDTPTEPIAEPPYVMGSWAGYASYVCNRTLPTGGKCGAGFIEETKFWDHWADHIIREMTPTQRAEAMLAAQGSPLVGPDGRPLR